MLSVKHNIPFTNQLKLIVLQISQRHQNTIIILFLTKNDHKIIVTALELLLLRQFQKTKETIIKLKYVRVATHDAA